MSHVDEKQEIVRRKLDDSREHHPSTEIDGKRKDFDPLAAAEVLWDICPEAKKALDKEDLERARKSFYGFLLRTEVHLDEPLVDFPPLDRLVVLFCLRVFKHIIRKRNERKSGGISTLKYLHALARGGPREYLDEIRIDFIEEMRHLFLGIMGKAEIYPDDLDSHSFNLLKGRPAAIQRSKQLDNLAVHARDGMNSYSSGLDADVVQTRKENVRRIRKHLKAKVQDWNNWQWQLRHVIRDSDELAQLVELTGEEREAIDLTVKNNIPFGITPYYVSLMDYEAGMAKDRAVRAQVIPGLAYVKGFISYKDGMKEADFMGEGDTSPIDLITRRYPNIVILKPFNTCAQICVYCQRNWEVRQVLDPKAEASKSKLKEAVKWIRENGNITEVLVTGGDPGIMTNKGLENVLSQLADIDHIERIRIGTRTPVVLPMRINNKFRDLLLKYNIPGKREVCVVTHFEHVYEVTPEAREAVQKLSSRGINLYNQLVYTTFNSRRFEAMALRRTLKLIGIDPYYTFSTKGKDETVDFRVPIARIQMERKEEARLFPGLLRSDAVVFNVPRLGKNYLQHGQDNRVIAIGPDGRRVYEFLPWEKNISRVDTYVYTDVSIYNYLRTLEELGEDPEDYSNIWYYY